MSNTTIMVPPAKWVKASIMEARTGYTQDAMNAKRKTGVWEEGVMWKKAPDGSILYSPRAYDEWAEKGHQAA